MREISELYFVYNADSGKFEMLRDGIHKIVSPETYSCNLCKLTYGSVYMKKEWREFLQTLSYPVYFLHRDEFRKRFSSMKNYSLPAVFVKREKKLEKLINSKQINDQDNIEGLMRLVVNKLDK